MTHDLLIRGFDDEIHSQLGELAKEKGVSINSIVKDAVDKWLKQQSDIPKKHYLLIYSDDDEDSILGLLKSMDRLAKESDLFRCFCGPPSTITTKLLSKLNWYDGTIMPYCYNETTKNIKGQKQNQQSQSQSQSQNNNNNKNIVRYCNIVMENIAKNANNKQVCCIDFLINDIAKSSLHQALTIEKAYDNSRIPGIMYCTYKTETLLNAEIKDLVELFEGHDQIFILKQDEVYKLHITKENVHKLFLN
ncbi:MAG TPA: hypothetical protein VLA74_10040 [Nitrososphaeraceae archaeon]|nr:hypothetical protein [Nitrososphaeraceae archaeon]